MVVHLRSVPLPTCVEALATGFLWKMLLKEARETDMIRLSSDSLTLKLRKTRTGVVLEGMKS